MADWQDISTAPKDGTRILLLRKQAKTGPTLLKNPVIGAWGAARDYKGCWSLEITSNHYAVNDDQLSAWSPLPTLRR